MISGKTDLATVAYLKISYP